ncbi:MAG: hypothetical protein KatS3mg105_1141 [Gemmatales bacterium]|nr:MAG: hypothetical protein KatS3mg105_1141 [Gemmatales bacterium]
MTAIKRFELVSVDDYLRAEEMSPVKHEYVGGVVYAMAGGCNRHNDIAGNIYAALHSRLRGRPCRPYNSTTRIRLRLSNQVRFYYPDVSVTCHPNRPTDTFQDEPAVIVEVLSDNSRRLDEGEKRDAYLAIPTLSAYILVEQETPAAVVFAEQKMVFAVRFTKALTPSSPLGKSTPNCLWQKCMKACHLLQKNDHLAHRNDRLR